jgi:ZIP family zinc transporter
MLLPILITFLAGLATTLGAWLVTRKRFLRARYMSGVLAFAAGAMLVLAFTELLPHGMEELEHAYGDRANLYSLLAFFAGIVFVAVLDRFLPHFHDAEPAATEGKHVHHHTHADQSLFAGGILLTVVFALHSLPEGFALFVASSENLGVGALMAAAIAAHNLPAGVAIAAPVFAATKNRARAIGLATIAGGSTLIGGLVGLFVVSLELPENVLGFMYSVIAGMLVYVVIDELLPAAHEHAKQQHRVVYGVILGMLFVAASLLLTGEHHH